MLFGAGTETEPKSDPNPASVSSKLFETETDKQILEPFILEDVPELSVVQKKSKESILEELNEMSNGVKEQKTEIVTKNETKLNFNIFGNYFNYM